MESARVSREIVNCYFEYQTEALFPKISSPALQQNDGKGEGIKPSGREQAHAHLLSTEAYSNEHDVSYFGAESSLKGAPQHAIPVIPEGTQLAIESTDTGSPPPNSATTSGSTSTPTSTGGISSSCEVQMKGSENAPQFPREDLGTSPTTSLQAVGSSRSADPNWSLSLSEGLIRDRYTNTSNIPLTEGDIQYPQSPGRYNSSSYPSAIKLLVSNNVAGSIIGRAGQTISELQTQSSARIKLSQTGDYYPGTQDRVCLVQGQLENVKVAVRLLLERLFMLQEQQHSQHLAWQPKQEDADSSRFDFVVRLLVPSSSCGMIIGKAGSNIRQMEEASGVSSIRLSPKDTADSASSAASATSERVVTLTGPTMESCLKCVGVVLDGMMSHQEISRYSNMTTSYSRVVVPSSFGQVPGANRALIVMSQGGNHEPSLWDTSRPFASPEFGKRSSSSPDLAGQILWDQRGGKHLPVEPATPSQLHSHVPRDPMSQYNPMFADPSPSFLHDLPPMIPSPVRAPPSATAAPPLYMLGTPSSSTVEQNTLPSSVSAPDLLATQLQESLRIGTSPVSAPLDYPHFAPQLPQPTPPGFTAQVLVPDSLIGSILGRGGRTLNELQMHSNTRIRISQRGEYLPGTRNRIVTIRGPTAQSVSVAQYLMSQRMVLPPTATYSAPPQYPSTQLQIRPIMNQPSQPPPQLLQFQDIQPIYQQASREALTESSLNQHPTATSSRTPSGSDSSKDRSHS